jgi:hypothetical protein
MSMTVALATLWMTGSTLAQNTPIEVNTDAKTMADFQERIKVYVELHQKIEGKLPSLPKEATPQQIDRNQRELGRLIREARASAKQGEIFTPDMQSLVKRMMSTLFAKAQGAQLRASIMDENPMSVKLAVNGRYPDEVPLATMPPQVLKTMPAMPEELEYRFVGDNLVILDDHAHIIVDFMPNVLPR